MRKILICANIILGIIVCCAFAANFSAGSAPVPVRAKKVFRAPGKNLRKPVKSGKENKTQAQNTPALEEIMEGTKHFLADRSHYCLRW